MRPLFAVTAGVSLLLLVSGTGWGRSRGGQSETGKDNKEAPANFNKTFAWEEKVVGPKDKGVDHDKIAAMQEQARREEAAKKREEMASGGPKKAPRADGITGPATATLPTMDIEKPAPAGSVRAPVRTASYAPPPRQHDDIDNVLAANGVGDGSSGSAEGLGSVLGGPSKVSKKAAHHPAKRAKHAKRGHRRR
jgi:hypothetical protein